MQTRDTKCIVLECPFLLSGTRKKGDTNQYIFIPSLTFFFEKYGLYIFFLVFLYKKHINIYKKHINLYKKHINLYKKDIKHNLVIGLFSSLFFLYFVVPCPLYLVPCTSIIENSVGFCFIYNFLIFINKTKTKKSGLLFFF